MTTYNDALSAYISATFAQEDDVLARVREQIPRLGLPDIMLQAEEAAFLQMMAAVSGAEVIVEIGSLGGYSGIWMARALPDDGKLITIEIDPEHAEVARRHFDLAGLAHKVELMEGNAHEVLPSISHRSPFDMLFIDADGRGYLDYLDWAMENLRTGGVIAAHNAFAYGGQVLDRAGQDEVIRARQEFNQRLASDPRLLSTIFPAGDGMSISVIVD